MSRALLSLLIVVLGTIAVLQVKNAPPEPPKPPKGVGIYCDAGNKCLTKITKYPCPIAANFSDYRGDVMLKDGTCKEVK